MSAPISIAEHVDRRLPPDAVPLAECPKCHSDEVVLIGLALVCARCGAHLQDAEGEEE